MTLKLESLNIYGYSDETNIKIEKLENSFEVSLDNDVENLAKPILFSISNGNIYEEVSFDFNKKKTETNHLFCFLAFLGGLILNFMPCVLPIFL